MDNHFTGNMKNTLHLYIQFRDATSGPLVSGNRLEALYCFQSFRHCLPRDKASHPRSDVSSATKLWETQTSQVLPTTPCSVCHIWHNTSLFITLQTALTDHKDRGLGSVPGFGTISAQQVMNGTLVKRNLHANESVSASSNRCSNAETTVRNTFKLAVK